MLRLKNINKSYFVSQMEVKALKNINLEFRKNEFVSILGPSGCGKTTMLNLIGGLDRYTSGDLLIDNKSTSKFNDSDWDSYRNYNVGFVFQNYNLIGHLSILQNVELALTLSGVSPSERTAAAKEALINVGLESQFDKKPNQLSGGQMQRVAIARALVNNPDILLADEPTGALDTKTSVQIMDLIQKISKNRLVIMVTHNPKLAEEYSTRIIRLLDGEIKSDSNPYDSGEITTESTLKNKGTSMSFLTALSLSFRNLSTKKFKTIITAVAGSIGIIGVALVLSLSNGFNRYIDKMQTDTLSSYPLTISEGQMSATDMLSALSEAEDRGLYPTENKVYVSKMLEKIYSSSFDNEITPEYVSYIKSLDKDLSYYINYDTGLVPERNVFFESNSSLRSLYSIAGSSVSTFSALPDNYDFINSQYDVLEGHLPKNPNEMILVVDKSNEVTDIELQSLGLYDMTSTKDSFDFSEILNTKYYLFDNDAMYEKTDSGFVTKSNLDKQNATVLTISAIVRLNEKTPMGSLSEGICYSPKLSAALLEKNLKSSIVDYSIKNPTINPFTFAEFKDTTSSQLISTVVSAKENSKKSLASIGGSTDVREIDIYAKDFESKTAIKDKLDEYNDNAEVKIQYSDIMSVMMDSIGQLVDIITYVLIAFSSISLIVSSVMIGIITYTSVVERTKEIGILRSVGARKKDISRVFNAETFIIGLYSGLIGVIVCYLLTIPINLILNNLVPNIGQISDLNILHAVALIIISIILTLIAGLIPSRIAAKKNPVEALRTE